MPTSNWREESVAVAGINVHYYRGGNGPPLLLLHGGEGNPGWLMHHEALAEQYSVYAPTHPGFGQTPALSWLATMADMAAFYLWCLEALGLQRVHVVGHDIGGWLAAEIATLCPQLIQRLVLVDAMGLKPHRQEILDIFLLTPAAIRAQSFVDPQQVPEWQRLYGTPPTPTESAWAEDALETLVRLCWKPFMHSQRLPFLLPRLPMPTLILWGRDDAIVPVECGKLYQRAIPGARLTLLEACGHCPQLEQPHAFAEAVKAFLH